MALVVKDRVKETSTSTGTGDFTLAGAVAGFQSFATALTNGDTTYYAITDPGTGDFEVGLGTYNAGVITRTTILESTNAGAAVNFQAGEKEVFITYPAEKAVYLDASNNIAVPGLVDGRDLAADGSKLDGIEAGATADQTAGEIKTAYESNANTNAYTDAEKTKLAGIEAGADVTDATNVEAAGAVMDADIGVTVQAYDANIVSDASYVHTDNNYTTTEKNKLAGIEAGATADQTKADIDALGINAATLGGNNAAYFTGYTDTAVANLVASAPGTLDTLNELAAALGDDPNFATTVTNSIATKLPLSGGTMTGNVSFGDNIKATFGAGSDLQIYHDGSSSLVTDQGTGNLKLQGTNLHLQTAAGVNYLYAQAGANLRLYYNGSEKLTTTNTGIDVTGTVTADGLTVDAGASDIAIVFDDNSVTNRYQFTTGGNSLDSYFNVNSDATRASHLRAISGSVSFDIASGFGRNDIIFAGADLFIKRGATKALEVDQVTGDISFYEDTGTTPKFFWDASAESLGIGTTSPAFGIDSRVNNGSNPVWGYNIANIVDGQTNNSGLRIASNASTAGIANLISATNSAASQFAFWTYNGSSWGERLRITSTGNVGIGETSPDTSLDVVGGSADSVVDTLTLKNDSTGSSAGVGLNFVVDGVNDVITSAIYGQRTGAAYHQGSLQFLTRDNAGGGLLERMRIDASGNVGIGTTSPSSKLTVDTGGNADADYIDINSSSTGRMRLGYSYTGGPTSTSYAQILADSNGNLDLSSRGNFASNIQFYTSSGSAPTERMRIDANGRVGIGLTNPDVALSLEGDLRVRDSSGNTDVYFGGGTGQAAINLYGPSQTTYSSILNNNSYTYFTMNGGNGIQYRARGAGTHIFSTTNSDTERMRIANNGNVGIGTTSPDQPLSVVGKMSFKTGTTTRGLVGSPSWDGGYVSIQNGTLAESAANAALYQNSLGITSVNAASGQRIEFKIANSEKMRLDSSGNLLVGKTADNWGTTGVQVHGYGVVAASRNGHVINANRETTDGDIVRFQKNGSTVGSIGVANNDIYIGTGDTTLTFIDGSNNINPTGTSGAQRSDAISLGDTNNRFKDGYFSGTVNAANFNTTSDATLKTNVETLTGSLDAVKALRGVSYDWIDSGNSEVGVIAQEVEAVIPDVVSTNDQGIKSVKYGNLVAVLIEAIKEQQAQIDELKAKLGD